jgi:hypothetical protein
MARSQKPGTRMYSTNGWLMDAYSPCHMVNYGHNRFGHVLTHPHIKTLSDTLRLQRQRAGLRAMELVDW